MRSRLNFMLTFFAFYAFLDIYTYFGLKSLFKTKTSKRNFSIVYWLISIFVYFSIYKFYTIASSGKIFSGTAVNMYIGVFFTAFVSKLFFVVFMSLQDVGRFLFGLGSGVRRMAKGEGLSSGVSFFPSRRRFLTLGATGLASIPFSLMLYGVTRGKYAYTVKNVKLALKDLPKAFDGLRIVQISDIHAGSLDSKSAVARGVRMVNEQNPDLIFFTGDLVNSDKNEVDPYIDIFKELHAKLGKYCILGNHDYYGEPDEEQEQPAYWEDFYLKYKAMGFHLMKNENTFLEKDGERICLIGVENWGEGRFFPRKGDLDLALANTDPEEFCILLSHDPSHWDKKVLEHTKKIHLTFSGHTHGFQFGVNMPGLKWSPVQYRYPRWNGLYEEEEQYLYVNRGFGFLGFPGRIGMWPEITVVDLSSAT